MVGEADEDAVFKKAAWRLVPFLGLLYFASFVDRVNVGFAALQMNADLGLSPEAYGFGAGIFFVTYAAFEVPSNLILERVGARRWIFRILVSWGVLSAATAFVWNDTSFYTLRFLLGAAEAGFLPGAIFYLSRWFPASMRGRIVGTFMAAVPFAGILGAPLSGAILGMNGLAGLAGWKWLFLIEGIPAALLGFAVLRYLPDGPADARWLSPAERDAIATRLKAEPEPDHHTVWPALKDPQVWALTLPYFGIVVTLYGVNFWLPQIVKPMGFSDFQTGLMVALPYVAAAPAMILWGRHSDRTQSRAGHFALAAFATAAGFALAALVPGNVAVFVGLAIATVGAHATFGPFWSIPPQFLRGAAAAAGIALINSVGNLGGFIGPTLIGLVKGSTGGYTAAMAVFAVVALLAGLVMIAIGRGITRRPAPRG